MKWLQTMTKHEYSWKYGSRPDKLDPTVVGKQFEKIEKRDKAVTPDSVVKANRAAKAPLHDYFEWDNNVAGDKYRCTQASYLIRSIVCKLSDVDHEEPIRAFVRVSTSDDEEDTGQYIHIHQAMNRPFTREQLLQQALEDLRAWRKKYSQLKELVALFREIDGFGEAG